MRWIYVLYAVTLVVGFAGWSQQWLSTGIANKQRTEIEHLETRIQEMETAHALEIQRLEHENVRAGVYKFLETRFTHHLKDSEL